MSELWRYPVKSTGGERLERADVSALGVAGDRHLAVVDDVSGKVLSAKTVPQLLALTATWRDLDIEIESAAGTLVVAASDSEADARLSAWLGRPVHLESPVPGHRAVFDLALDPDDPTEVVELQTPPGSFFDSRSTLHLLTTTSAGPHDIRRFRPNLVVEAASDDAYPEDGWVGARLLVGANVEATVRKATARCVLVTKPQPGLDHDSGIFRELVRERGGLLGVYLDPQTSGAIAVGDAVEVMA